jgi:predicted nucleic acid-binding protein
MQVIMDTDALIKIVKVSLKELIVSNVSIHIADGVREESVDEGKAKGYPDAILIEQNLQAGKINVVKTRENKGNEIVTKDLRLRGGEADSLKLFRQGKFDSIVSDDQKFLDLIDSLGIPFLTSSALLLYLYKKGIISGEDARKSMEKLRPMISNEEYFTAMDAIG